jgi:hypothetical protein
MGNIQNETARFEHDGSNEVKGKKIFLYGWDADNLAPVKLKVASDGSVVVDPTALDDRYVNVTGDTMTGSLTMTTGQKIYLDTDQQSWFTKNGNAVELWVENTLSASWEEDAVPSSIGMPMGMLLTLTYAEEV